MTKGLQTALVSIIETNRDAIYKFHAEFQEN